MVQHLCSRLENGGESSAAELVSGMGTIAEVARELAYRLYTISERNKRAAEAFSYNGLVQSWPEIIRLSRDRATPQMQQAQMFSQE
jgi:putative DNA methylase